MERISLAGRKLNFPVVQWIKKVTTQAELKFPYYV